MNQYHKYSFEKLDVWQDSRVLANNVYKMTNTFPDYEKFGISNQMRRAAISVSSNIAEGTSRVSNKDQAHFYQIAYSSLMELLNQIIISNDLEFLSNETEQEMRQQIEKVANKINALRKSRLNK